MTYDDRPLLAPERLWTCADIMVPECPVPRSRGVYAWYFRRVPHVVPTAGCRSALGATLLYVGISPKRPPTNGRAPSGQSLRHRIRYHLRGNAAGSTLRLTLGCLLGDSLSLTLRRVGSGERYTFADGEERLSQWMAENALVTWLNADEPWTLEEDLIARLDLPLNLDQNRRHPFHSVLSAKRREARKRALALPLWVNDRVDR